MIVLSAFMAGFASLVVEVVGVHFMAPWFGSSSLVWSNQIGLILLAFAVGAAIGGRAARKHPNPQVLVGKLFVGAAFLLASGVLLLPIFAAWLLPDQLRLDQAANLFLSGSFASALLFHCPPVLLLAMIAPLLIQVKSKQIGAGAAAGIVSASGTIGSLIGVFGSSFLFVPLIGVRLSLLIVAFLLIVNAMLLFKRNRLKLPASGTVTGLLVVSAIMGSSTAANSANLPDPQAKVLAVRDSSYQHLRVLEMPTGDRWLQMNEGVDSYQSVWSPNPVLYNPTTKRSEAQQAFVWPGGYYDLFSLLPTYALDEVATPESVKFWSLGFASGTALGPIDFALQKVEWQAVGVELDPLVVELSKEFLPLPTYLDERVDIFSGDARALLRSAPSDLDFVVLDAYARQFEIPLHLATKEFFTEVYSHLKIGGVLALNLGTTDLDKSGGILASSIFAGLEKSFGKNLRAHQVPWSRNIVVFARKQMALPSLEQTIKQLPPGMPVTLGGALLPEQVFELDDFSKSSAFSDDLNPLAFIQAQEWLAGGK